MHTTRSSKNTPSRGFSLVELMVAMVIAIIVMAGAYNVYTNLHKTWLAEDIKAELQQTTRVAMDNMVREMMMMGYTERTDKIIYASSEDLQFYEYIKDGTGTYKEYLLQYYKSGTNLLRTSQQVDPPGTPETITLAHNLISLSYTYYDANNNLIAGNPVPTGNLNDIRRIFVRVEVQSKKKMPGTDEYKTMTLTANLSPRNLWEGEVNLDAVPPDKVENLHVVDTLTCGYLKATWDAIDEEDIAGYMVKYGTASDVYTSYVDVPVESAGDPPSKEFEVDMSPYISDSGAYYVVVQAYDSSHNYGEPSDEVGPADPYPNITGFSQSGNDTTNNVPKPAAPSGLATFNVDTAPGCPEGAIKLTWNKSTNPNVVGYRVYRSYTSFSPSAFPIEPDGTVIKQLAKETEGGDGWPGDRSDSGGTNDGSYIDDDTSLIGCDTYYYAVCAVTCDRTRILGDASHTTEEGGRYTQSQYATATGSAVEHTPTSSPAINGMPGWKRVFIQVTWPTDNDYAYTKVYFKAGATGPGDLPELVDANLIPDHQDGQPKGTFVDYGTAAQNTIIFNSDSADIGDTDQPALVNNTGYSFVAVSYDKCGNPSSASEFATTFAELCGDDPCGAPVWPSTVTPKVWVDAATTNRDASTWLSDAQIIVGLKWTDVDKTDPGTALDFFGYNIKRTDESDEQEVTVGEWNNYIVNGGLNEGATYYYCVRATDCVWQNITPADAVVCNEITYYYDDIRANNISPCVTTSPLKPGRIKMYQDPLFPVSQYGYATTDGVYNNMVKFKVVNTSAGTLTLTGMKLTWGNTAAFLKKITIGPSVATSQYDVEVGLGNSGLTTVSMPDIAITDLATAPGSPSVSIPVTLEFVNSNNTVSRFTDMRNEVLKVEFIFKNNSMNVSGFTTGDIFGTNPITIGVTGGPSINYVIQNKPSNPTTSFAVFGCTTTTVLPSGYPTVGGGQTVTVTTNITKPSIETLGNVRLRYALTPKSAVSPMAYAFGLITSGTVSGNNYSTDKIPVGEDQGVWFYIEAETLQGNKTRAPKTTDSFLYYYQEPFDVCDEYPLAPANATRLSTTLGHMQWDAVTKYQSGVAVPAGDTIVYDVYRRVLNGSYFLPQSDGTGLTVTSYKDTTPYVAGTNYEYAVKARNSCNNASANFSDNVIFCGGATGCVVTVSPSSLALNTNWTTGSQTCTTRQFNLSVFICDRAGDGSVWNPADGYDTLSDITMTVTSASGYENSHITLIERGGDSGIFTYNGGLGTMNLTSLYSVYGTSSSDNTFGATAIDGLSDTLTLMTDSSITNCASVSATLSVTTDPCANTPRAPTITSASRSSKNLNSMTWTAVTTNTDGSPAVYASDSVSYQVWYAESSETDLNNFALLGSTTATSFSGTNLLPNPNATYKLYVKAVDTCTPANSSVPSNVITLTKSGTY